MNQLFKKSTLIAIAALWAIAGAATAQTTAALTLTPAAITTPTSLTTTAPATSATTVTVVSETPTSVTLPGGVIYQILKKGDGPVANTTATRLIHYTLYLANGKKLESSRDAEFPVPFEFAPGKKDAIVGMDEGTNGMRVGEIRKIFVPSDKAYGDTAHGTVPANSDLIFKVELVDLK